MALCVADTGAGLAAHPGTGGGIGLANIRERLALLFGDDATLELEENAPRGFRARILLPLARHAPLRSHPPSFTEARPT
jgi:LytS/YehU family sensor histidine kinase